MIAMDSSGAGAGGGAGTAPATNTAITPVPLKTPAPGTAPAVPAPGAAPAPTPGITGTTTPDTAALVPPPVPAPGSVPSTGFAGSASVAAAPPAPTPIPPVPIGTAPAFSPTSNSVGSVIAPTTDSRLAGMNGQVDSALSGITSAPDRYALAQKQYDTYANATNPAQEAALTQAEKMASATGTNGSGMLNTTFGNLALQRARDLQNERDTLFNTAQQNTMADREGTLAAVLGAQSQTAGQDAAARGEQRTERQYQADAGQTALANAESQAALNDSLTNSAFNRAATQTQMGYANDPALAELTAAGQQGQTAAAGAAGTGSLMSLLAANGSNPNWDAILNLIQGLPKSTSSTAPDTSSASNGGTM